ncbi:toll/interleukin-1 receptor domain-containing protein [Streptomyces massasporeus]|uniref:toll/interleukin-1 receptor domain-containing protein n=1 Tax=Streptomyces massasporeus TaxID=67324 RepID=UPI0036A0F43D
MSSAEFTVTTVGTLAGLAGAYFAYLPIAHRLRRRRSLPPSSPVPSASHYDVFISHSRADATWAGRLASALREAGLSVFLDAWSIEPGQVVSIQRGEGIRSAANGILVFSRAALASPETMDDYAAILNRVHSGGRLFVPVVIEEVPLPPFAAIRRPVDLTTSEGGSFEEKIERLARVLSRNS